MRTRVRAQRALAWSARLLAMLPEGAAQGAIALH